MYHSIIDGQHAFELSMEEMADLTLDAAKNGAKVTMSINGIDVDFDDFGWGLMYDNGEGVYFLYMHDDSQEYLEYLAESLGKQCQAA